MEFNNKYNLWFHKLNDKKWNIDSYKNICTLENLDDFLFTFNRIKNLTSGMFFLMKNEIQPIYEDKNNKNGGVWMWKVSKKKASSIMLNICYLMIHNNLTKNSSDSKYINGISINPKINNCIIKIWITGTQKKNIFRNDIPNIFLEDGLYKLNKE